MKTRFDRPRRTPRLWTTLSSIVVVAFFAVLVPYMRESPRQSESAPGRPVRASDDVPAAGAARLHTSEGLSIHAVDEGGGHRIHGRVLDLTGGAVADATLWRVPSPVDRERAWSLLAAADAEGRFELWLPSGEHRLHVSREGYAPRTLNVSAGRDDRLDVYLTPGAAVVGRVLDIKGGGVAGAVVTLTRARSDQDLATTRTAGDGEFSFPSLNAGEYEVFARSDETIASGQRILVLRPAERQEVVLVLGSARTIVGRVTRAGAPAAGVQVLLSRSEFRDDAGRSSAVTDASGSFRVPGVLPEDTWIIAAADALTRAVVRIPAAGATEAPVLLALPDSGRLVVRTTTTSDHPLPGATISIRTERSRVQVTSGPDGTAVVDPVPATKLTIRAEHPSGGAAGMAIEIPAGGERVASLRLTRTRTIPVQGRVAFDDGAPAGNVTVAAYCYGPGWTMVSADATGAFRVDGCEAGPLSLRPLRRLISDDEWRATYTMSRQPELREDEAVRTPTLRLSRGGRSIRGRVVDPQARPVAEARVRVRGPGVSAETVTDGFGAFEIGELDLQDHSVRVSAGGYVEARVEVPADSKGELLVSLREGTTVRGRVHDGGGRGLPFVRVLLSSAERDVSAVEGHTGADGSFVLHGVAAGAFEAFVREPGGFDRTAGMVRIEGRAEQRIDLRPK